MGLGTVVRKAVAIAKKTIKTQDQDGLLVRVTHRYGGTRDVYGAIVHPSSRTLDVVLISKFQLVRNVNGQEVTSSTQLTILEDVTVTLDDEFVLPDGSVETIISIGGAADPTTGRPYATRVYLV